MNGIDIRIEKGEICVLLGPSGSCKSTLLNIIDGIDQAIHFTGDDMTGDNSMFTVFLYIVIVIISFIMAITTSSTIVKEANVIGTLRASGYTKGELVRHYLAHPP